MSQALHSRHRHTAFRNKEQQRLGSWNHSGKGKMCMREFFTVALVSKAIPAGVNVVDIRSGIF